ncbi:MAG TPA: HEAT repeat domain-containing protein [Candidatus Limnocylindrales bacterium]|nr:HEAT repeat domain-containing protein [Candidatus Limnocylindrales bacterium]
MRWRYTIGVLISLGWVLAAILVGLYLREPHWQGRSLSAWLSDLDVESSRPQAPAVAAIQGIGTNALPQLNRMLCAMDPGWKRALIGFNYRQSIFEIPITPARVLRNRAIQGYTALGPRAKSSIPTLIQLLESEASAQVRSGAAAALGGIGPEAKTAVPVLARALKDPNSEVRKESLSALANIQRWSPGR